MADIAAGDLTYTVSQRRKVNGSPSRYENKVTIAFGNATLTYPSGGIPLTKASLGLPNVIDSLLFIDEANADGFVYKYDATNAKIRIYQGDNNNASDSALIELVAATAAPAATTLIVRATGY